MAAYQYKLKVANNHYVIIINTKAYVNAGVDLIHWEVGQFYLGANIENHL